MNKMTISIIGQPYNTVPECGMCIYPDCQKCQIDRIDMLLLTGCKDIRMFGHNPKCTQYVWDAVKHNYKNFFNFRC
jgi:hypothetical protein